MALEQDFSHLQDKLGALVRGVYTPLCLFFKLEDSTRKDEIVRILTRALTQVTLSFPYLAGKVTTDNTGSEESNHGRPLIKSMDQSIRLVVKDYTEDISVPSLAALGKFRFPSSMIVGRTFTSLSGAPSMFGNSSDEAQPVFFVQANFITGGLALSFAGEHSVMDGQGMGQIITLVSKACHDKPCATEDIREGNRPRDDIVPLLDSSTYKPGPELDYLVVKHTTDAPRLFDQPPSECKWAYFRFSASNLAKLKALASKPDVNSGCSTPLTPYITTNDALSALIWQTACRARFPHLTSSPTTPPLTSTFGRAIDARPSLSISPFYPGNLSHHTYTTLPILKIHSSTLHHLSSLLRSALSPTSTSYSIRSLATTCTLASPSQRRRIHYGANMDFTRDIFFSSWTRLPCYDLDFNLGLGSPLCVRRPEFMAIEGLMYLMPMKQGEGIDAAVCLKVEELERLRQDTRFVEFAEWIG